MNLIKSFIIVLALSSMAATCPGPAPTPQPVPPPKPVSIATSAFYWYTPTKNTDGSPLVDLGGFKVYVGTTSSIYTTVSDIANPNADYMDLDVVLTKPGTYYFAVSAYDTLHVEGPLSSELKVDVVQ